MNNPAIDALEVSGLAHTVTRHGRVGSLAESAAARGVEPADIIKTMVVRRAEDDHLLVLVPGDRSIAWPKLRALLGVSRLSMPDAAEALRVTGFERGTITPFGTLRPLPVVADERVAGHRISIAPEPDAPGLGFGLQGKQCGMFGLVCVAVVNPGHARRNQGGAYVAVTAIHVGHPAAVLVIGAQDDRCAVIEA